MGKIKMHKGFFHSNTVSSPVLITIYSPVLISHSGTIYTIVYIGINITIYLLIL